MNNSVSNLRTFINNGGNAQQVVQRLIQSNTNPMINNLMKLAQKGEANSVENFARNMFKEQGRDFDKEFNEFMNHFK